MKCLNPKCKKEIIQTSENGEIALDDSKKILHDDKTDYLSCQHCGAKNLLSPMPGEKGKPMQYKLTKFSL